MQRPTSDGTGQAEGAEGSVMETGAEPPGTGDSTTGGNSGQNQPTGTTQASDSTVGGTSSGGTSGGGTPGDCVPPAPQQWTHQGEVLARSEEGWDTFRTRAPSVVVKDGTYYLFYQSAAGRRVSDGGPAYRAVGVATSDDGIAFTKYADNPVITFVPDPQDPNAEETGALAPAVATDSAGGFVMYYGALTAVGGDSVDVDTRIATSADGFAFGDDGIILTGDEIWPTGVLADSDGMWSLWYTVSGGAHVGLARGTDPMTLTDLGAVLNERGKTEHAWPVLCDDGTVYTFEVSGDAWSGPIRVRSTSLDDLESYSDPIMVFDFDPPVVDPMILRDTQAGEWRMYGAQIEPVPGASVDMSIHLWTAPL